MSDEGSTKAGNQLEALYASQLMLEPGLDRRESIQQRVAHIIGQRWPGAQLDVDVYGASFMGPTLRGAGLDLVIMDPSKPLGLAGPTAAVPGSPTWLRPSEVPEWYDVNLLAAVIAERAGTQPNGTPGCKLVFGDVCAVQQGRFPAVTFTAKADGGKETRVKLVVNERLAFLSNFLLGQYAQLQEDIFHFLLSGLPRWFEASRLCDGPGGFSSYAIRLLAIRFLQEFRLLPDLQCPLLLQQLRMPEPLVLYDSERGSQAGAHEWKVSFCAPDIDGMPTPAAHAQIRTCDRLTLNGLSFRFFHHPSVKLATLPPLMEWFLQPWALQSDAQPHRFAAGPPNGLGLHSTGGMGRRGRIVSPDVGSLLASFFHWVGKYVDGNMAAHDHERVLAINRHGAYATLRENAAQWASSAVVIPDPFVLTENVAGNVTKETMTKMRAETQRAMRIAELKLDADWDLYHLLDPQRAR